MMLRLNLILLSHFLINILLSSQFCICVGSEQDSEDSLRLGNDTTNQYYFNLTDSINQQDNKEFYISLGNAIIFLENL